MLKHFRDLNIFFMKIHTFQENTANYKKNRFLFRKRFFARQHSVLITHRKSMLCGIPKKIGSIFARDVRHLHPTPSRSSGKMAHILRRDRLDAGSCLQAIIQNHATTPRRVRELPHIWSSSTPGEQTPPNAHAGICCHRDWNAWRHTSNRLLWDSLSWPAGT